jgi:hypothetical protein
VPSDPFHLVSNSGLLNTPQLGSLYSSVGTRVHLVLGFTPLLKESGELDDGASRFALRRVGTPPPPPRHPALLPASQRAVHKAQRRRRAVQSRLSATREV